MYFYIVFCSQHVAIQPHIVSALIQMLDDHNVHAKSFRMARDRLTDSQLDNVKLRLIAGREKDGRTNNLPNVFEVAALIVGDFDADSRRDIIVETQNRELQRILRYVKGTIDYGIRFSQVKSFNLLGYSDSDWAGCVDDKRSTSGYCFTLGFSMFSLCYKKQEVIAQSTTEAEYIADVVAVNQALWIRNLMIDLHT